MLSARYTARLIRKPSTCPRAPSFVPIGRSSSIETEHQPTSRADKISTMSNTNVGHVYSQIINDVIEAVRVDFEESGVDEAVLGDLTKVSIS